MPQQDSGFKSVHTRATFLGLPAELRLQIYTYLADSAQVHADYILVHGLYYQRRRMCAAPHMRFSQLCTRPYFLDLLSAEEPCTLCTEWAGHATAIRSTCKFLHEETHGVFDRHNVGLTIPVRYANSLFGIGRHYKHDPIRKPCQITARERTALERLTLSYHGEDQMHTFVDILRHNPHAFPALRTIAVQALMPHYKFCVKRPGNRPLFHPRQTWRNPWFVNALHSVLQGNVTVILEAWVLNTGNQRTADEIVTFRGVVWGSKENKTEESKFFGPVRRSIVVGG